MGSGGRRPAATAATRRAGLLHGLLARVEGTAAPNHRTEDLRRELAQQVLDRPSCHLGLRARPSDVVGDVHVLVRAGELFTPPGSWSVHNTEVNGDHAYSSWYSHGIVALDLANPASPTLVGQFVPPTSDRFAGSLGHAPAEVWGVAIDPETGIVYASDMRTGLWIVEPTGPAAP